MLNVLNDTGYGKIGSINVIGSYVAVEAATVNVKFPLVV